MILLFNVDAEPLFFDFKYDLNNWNSGKTDLCELKTNDNQGSKPLGVLQSLSQFY